MHSCYSSVFAGIRFERRTHSGGPERPALVSSGVHSRSAGCGTVRVRRGQEHWLLWLRSELVAFDRKSAGMHGRATTESSFVAAMCR